MKDYHHDGRIDSEDEVKFDRIHDKFILITTEKSRRFTLYGEI
jgi:hypothetical protein